MAFVVVVRVVETTDSAIQVLAVVGFVAVAEMLTDPIVSDVNVDDALVGVVPSCDCGIVSLVERDFVAMVVVVRIRIVLHRCMCSSDFQYNPKQHPFEIDVATEDATVDVVAGVVTEMLKTLLFHVLVVVVAAAPLVASPFPSAFVRPLVSHHVSTGIPDCFCGRNWGMLVAWRRHRSSIFCEKE